MRTIIVALLFYFTIALYPQGYEEIRKSEIITFMSDYIGHKIVLKDCKLDGKVFPSNMLTETVYLLSMSSSGLDMISLPVKTETLLNIYVEKKIAKKLSAWFDKEYMNRDSYCVVNVYGTPRNVHATYHDFIVMKVDKMEVLSNDQQVILTFE